MSRLKNINIQGSQYTSDNEGNELLHVSNIHALIQAVGYLKHIAEPYERVFFRGQTKLYNNMTPPLYRGIKSKGYQNKKHEEINNVIEHFRLNADIFSNIPSFSHEPLLQHYGIKTTWLDVVDNIWVALWFSLYKSYAVGKKEEFLHFDQRGGYAEHKSEGTDEKEKYGYIILICASENRRLSKRKGTIDGSRTEVIDLRITTPSIFLRPHSQHGLLFRARADSDGRIMDYREFIRGIIRFNVDAANSWLGTGSILGVRSLFPPPYFDKGYEILLKSQPEDSKIGKIQHIGA